MNRKVEPIAIEQLQSVILGDQSPSYTLTAPIAAWACLAFTIADVIGNIVGLYGPTGWLLRLKFFPTQQGLALVFSAIFQVIVLYFIVVPNLRRSRWQFGWLPSRTKNDNTQGAMPYVTAIGGILLGLVIFGFMAYFASEKGLTATNVWNWKQGKVSSSNVSLYKATEYFILILQIGIIASLPIFFDPIRYSVTGGSGQLSGLLDLKYKDYSTRAVLLQFDQQNLRTFIVLQENDEDGRYYVRESKNKTLDVRLGNYLLIFPEVLKDSFGPSTIELRSKGDFFVCKSSYIVNPSTTGLSKASFSSDSIQVFREQLFQNTSIKRFFDGVVQRVLDEYVDESIKATPQKSNKIPVTAISFKEMFERLNSEAQIEKSRNINVSLPKDLLKVDVSTLHLARTNLENSVDSLNNLLTKLDEKLELWEPYRDQQKEARTNLPYQFSSRVLDALAETAYFDDSDGDQTQQREVLKRDLDKLLHLLGLKLSDISLGFCPGYALECEGAVLSMNNSLTKELTDIQSQTESRLEAILTKERDLMHDLLNRVVDLAKEVGPVHAERVMAAVSRMDAAQRNKALEAAETATTPETAHSWSRDVLSSDSRTTDVNGSPWRQSAQQSNSVKSENTELPDVDDI